MPNASKGARLYLRERANRAPKWVILDGTKEVATGFGHGNREAAERALAEYIGGKYDSPAGPCGPHQMTIDRALAIYGNERAPKKASARVIGCAIEALLPFWGEQPVSAIKENTCTAYERKRKRAAATVRRELVVLRTAVNYCVKQGYLTHAPTVSVPAAPKGGTRWLTEKEACALLRAARRVPHLATFILIGLYTGTRGGAILNLQWIPNTEGGWIDLERGMLHRGAERRVETNKRQPPCPLPGKLVAHLRRVRRRTRRFVIEFNGERVTKLRRSWATACRAAGMGRDVTPHVLRHTAVTWRLLAGVKIWDVANYVGMSEKMVRDVYGHHAPDHLHEARDAI